MQNNSYDGKMTRGSSPHTLIPQEPEDHLRGIRSIKHAHNEASPTHSEDHHSESRYGFVLQDTTSSRHLDDDGRWHDDGGEGG